MFWLLACADPALDRPLPGVDRFGTSPADTAAWVDSTPSAPDSPAHDSQAPDPEPEAFCGDGVCQEDCWSCASDCGACDCPTDVEVLFYTTGGWNVLADALLADPSPCMDVYFSLPSYAGDKLTPRGDGHPEALRARSPRFQAVAEFHWHTWKKEEGSWYERGVRFRELMVDAGYDIAAGDTWSINELPSDGRHDPELKQALLDVTRGLYEGPSGAPKKKGMVFVIGMGHKTVNYSVYKPILREWLSDKSYWEGVANTTRWWVQETYADPGYVCVPDTTVGSRAKRVNSYTQHVANLATAGPDSANTAQSYFNRAFVPMTNAIWQSDAGYGDTRIPLEQMQHFVSGNVYAQRAWSNDHNWPDGRIAFSWGRAGDATNDDLAVLAERLASSLHYAYDEGGGAAKYACSPSGAYTWCQCSQSGAAFNDGWDSFTSW